MRTRETNTDPIYVNPGFINHWTKHRITPGTNLMAADSDLAVVTWPSSPVIVDLSSSKITDDPGPTRTTKPVLHVKERIVRYNVSDEIAYVDWNGNGSSYNGDGYHDSGNYCHFKGWGWYSGEPLNGVNPKVSVVWPKTVNQLRSQALHSFAARNQVDNLLNAVESSQLKTSSADVFEQLRKLKDANSAKALARRTLGALHRSSSFYLFYSFGIAPLLSDIKKINSGIVTLKHDLDQMIKMYNKPVRVSAQCSGSLVKNPAFISSGYSDDHTTGWWDYSINQVGPIRQLVGVRGRRNVEYNSDAFKKLHYVISRYVATGPASFVWERIPFSFVVDWFADLHGILDALDNALTGFSQSVEDTWQSQKYSYIVPHKFFSRAGYWQSTVDGQITMQQELSYYSRSSLPTSIMPVASGRFGKNQLGLLAALIHQYVAKLR
jgi:hypothetical protein